MFSLLYSSEVQRIESIVKDIVELRADYEECKKSLGADRNFRAERFEKRVKELEIKNAKLEDELSKKYTSTSISDETITKFKKLLASKDKEIASLKKALKEKPKKVKSKKEVVKRVVHKPKKVKKPKKTTTNKIEYIKPSTFRLNKDSDIYGSLNGDKIEKWEKNTTFTSNQKANGYIKITGCFEDSKWHSVKQEKWIKESDVYKK
jgi:chromosome segregation ATPase